MLQVEVLQAQLPRIADTTYPHLREFINALRKLHLSEDYEHALRVFYDDAWTAHEGTTRTNEFDTQGNLLPYFWHIHRCVVALAEVLASHGSGLHAATKFLLLTTMIFHDVHDDTSLFDEPNQSRLSDKKQNLEGNFRIYISNKRMTSFMEARAREAILIDNFEFLGSLVTLSDHASRNERSAAHLFSGSLRDIALEVTRSKQFGEERTGGLVARMVDCIDNLGSIPFEVAELTHALEKHSGRLAKYEKYIRALRPDSAFQAPAVFLLGEMKAKVDLLRVMLNRAVSSN